MEVDTAFRKMGLEELNSFIKTPVSISFAKFGFGQPSYSWPKVLIDKQKVKGSLTLDQIATHVFKVYSESAKKVESDFSWNENSGLWESRLRQIHLAEEIVKSIHSIESDAKKLLEKHSKVNQAAHDVYTYLFSYQKSEDSNPLISLEKRISNDKKYYESKHQQAQAEKIKQNAARKKRAQNKEDFFSYFFSETFSGPSNKSHTNYYEFGEDDFIKFFFQGTRTNSSRAPQKQIASIPDPYKALGINSTASQDEIKKTYRDLARRLHPDKNPNNPSAKEKFQNIQNAFELLSNAERRRNYDQFGIG